MSVNVLGYTECVDGSDRYLFVVTSESQLKIRTTTQLQKKSILRQLESKVLYLKNIQQGVNVEYFSVV